MFWGSVWDEQGKSFKTMKNWKISRKLKPQCIFCNFWFFCEGRVLRTIKDFLNFQIFDSQDSSDLPNLLDFLDLHFPDFPDFSNFRDLPDFAAPGNERNDNCGDNQDEDVNNHRNDHSGSDDYDDDLVFKKMFFGKN